MPGLASASIVFKGDFETGNLSQWDKRQVVAPDRLQVQSDLVREGKHALKVTVRKGDDPINASGNRNELLYMGLERAGTENYYKWSTYFPASFPRANTWQVFAQWHHLGLNGSPPVEFFIIDDEIRLRAGGVNGPIVWRAPMERERWHDFVLHVKWSPDPKVGFVELYKDGELVVPRFMVATQFRGDTNYFKLGLYRNESISPVGVLYHDGVTVATTLEEVMPPAPEPVPEPVPEELVAEPEPTPAPSPEPDTSPAPTTPAEESPVVIAPGGSVPPYTPEPGNSVLPGDTGASLDAPGLGGAPSGCGASSTGGMPVVAAASLLAVMFVVRRRRPQALAPVRHSKR